MELKNGYKLIYEVVEEDGDGKKVRSFKASKECFPTAEDITITSTAIGSNKLVYEYKGRFYGTGTNSVPTYNEDGTPADEPIKTIDDNFEKVFVEGYTGTASYGRRSRKAPTQQETPVTEPETPAVDPVEAE
jgi:hypothetical protein